MKTCPSVSWRYMNSYFLPDNKKLKLSKDDIFDRIINLKLTVRKRGGEEIEEFIVRSDYEVVYIDQSMLRVLGNGAFTVGKYYIKRCTYKPNIRFTYESIGGGTNINLDLYISNFFIFSSDGTVMANFNKKDYDLIKVEVMMGYWGQFKDMPHDTIDDLFKFEPMFGADKIVMNEVEYVTTDGLPPDYRLHIHGFVASVFSPPADEGEEPSTYTEAEHSPQIVTTDDNAKKGDLEQIFEKQISARFTRIATDVLPNGHKVSVQTWDKVNVYLSPKAKEIKLKGLRDKDGNLVQRKTYFKKGVSLGNAMTSIIQKVAPKKGLDYKLRNDGNIVVFTQDDLESVSEITDEIRKIEKAENNENTFTEVYDNKLPAVININVSTTATIICPFFAFINPFQEIDFEYRYHVSDLVSYYASIETKKKTFLAIRIRVAFDTVENKNEMEIYCTIRDKG